MNFLDEVKQMSEQSGIPILGYLVYWMIPDGARFTHDAITRHCEDRKLDTSTIPMPMNPRKAWTRARNRWKKEGTPGIELRQLGRKGDVLYEAAISAKANLAEQKLDMRNETWVGLDISTGVFAAKEPTGKVAQSMEHIYKDALTHFSEPELRMFLYNVVESMEGYPIRPTGGIYFVPAAAGETIGKVMEVVHKVHPHARLWAVPQFKTGHTQRILAENYTQSAYAELEKFRTQIRHWVGRTTKKQGRSYATQLRVIGEMRKKSTMFEAILEQDLTEVREALKKFEDEIKHYEDGGDVVQEDEQEEEVTQQEFDSVVTEAEETIKELEEKKSKKRRKKKEPAPEPEEDEQAEIESRLNEILGI